MFDYERATNEFMVQYLHLLMQTTHEADMDAQPCEGFNPPRWILGHLAVYTDYALRMLGERFQCDKEWHRRFARGTEAISRPAKPPPRDELVRAIDEGFARVRELTLRVDPDRLQAPHGIPFLKDSPLQTVGELTSHLMTTHFAAHLGQLSAWRRMMGRPPIETTAMRSASQPDS